jgi:hypothetical protein
MGKTKRLRVRNAHIREEFRMEDIQNKIEGNTLRWFKHIKRTEEHRILERLLEMKMAGKRHMARPRTWWLDQVKTDKERRGRSWGEAEETKVWTDRDSWKLL